MTLLSLLRGLSRVNMVLLFVLVTTVINIFCSWFFLYVLKIGLSGAAWGTVVSHAVGVLIAGAYLWRRPQVRNTSQALPSRRDWFNFGRNSANLFVRSFALTSSLFIGMHIAAKGGAEDLAAHQVLLQIWLFVSFFIDGVAITASIKGAEFLKRRDLLQLRATFAQVVGLALGLGAFFSGLYWLFGAFIRTFFSSDEAVIAQLEFLWPWIVWAQIPNALCFVYDGILFGLGEIGGFVWVRRWMVAAATMVFLPIAFFGNSIFAVWCGFIAMNVFRWMTGAWSVHRLVKTL